MNLILIGNFVVAGILLSGINTHTVESQMLQIARQASSTESTKSDMVKADAVKDIESVLQAQVEHWNDADIDRFMETYWKSEELSFSSGGKVTRGWQATIDRYKKTYSSPEKMGSLTFGELEITLLGESAAMVLGNWHLTFAESTNAEPVGGNFTLVLRKLDDGWKIIHDHTSTETTTD